MKLKITLLIAAFVSLFANAIYAGRASDGNAKIIYWQAPSILNPYLSSGTKDIESASLVIEPLGRYDEKGALVPWLAEEIPTVGNGGVSSDLTTITWKLKKGLLWSDGSAVTSADVKFTADYCMDPDGGCAQLNKFDGIKSIDTPDDRTIVITFNAPKPNPYGPFMGGQTPILKRLNLRIVKGLKLLSVLSKTLILLVLGHLL